MAVLASHFKTSDRRIQNLGGMVSTDMPYCLVARQEENSPRYSRVVEFFLFMRMEEESAQPNAGPLKKEEFLVSTNVEGACDPLGKDNEEVRGGKKHSRMWI
mmetsp:Transcript_41266/g.56236  ORF Transcript_41266/g.56236 Transcript_41266/m.56236 type:complete len:102 (-) Transcript_41266:245-550(-)